MFSVLATASFEGVEEFNRFLREHRVLNVGRKLAEHGTTSFWTSCVEYLEVPAPTAERGQGKVDYRELLSPLQFERFARLRALRKTLVRRRR